MKQAAYAQQKGAQDQIYLKTRQAGRLQKSNMTLKELYTKVETMHRVLTKIYNNSKVVIEDTESEIEITAKEWETVKAATSAMKSAMNLINGNKDRRAIYEEAYEVLSDDIANKSGELEQMLEMSESFMSNIDLQNGMLQGDGLKMLEEWEKKADSWLTNSSAKNDAVTKVTGTPVRQTLSDSDDDSGSGFKGLFSEEKRKIYPNMPVICLSCCHHYNKSEYVERTAACTGRAVLPVHKKVAHKRHRRHPLLNPHPIMDKFQLKK
jgi:hypothetical protein